MNKSPHIAIIGGGASGLIAAITASRNGAKVTILERSDRVGKKLLATGNGRCNLSNVNTTPGHFHGANPEFVAPALAGFTVEHTRAFFDGLGACTIVEADGKVFPLTLQASTVLDVLRFEVERCGCTVMPAVEVIEIIKTGKGFELRFGNDTLHADRVIVAAGGKAAPQLGGTDSGIALLKKLGHSVCQTYPALVPLKTDSSYLKQLKGTKINVLVELSINGKTSAIENGELLFTDYGLSGPPIIQLSLAANRALTHGDRVTLSLDLFQEWTLEQIAANIKARFAARPNDLLETALIGLLHKRLIPSVIHGAGIATVRELSSKISGKELERLVAFVKHWPCTVTGSLPWRDAQLMAGGVSTADFSAQTLESSLVPGVYAAGEVLDIAGDCGGYNLQWAWSSGYTAGLHAARI